MNTLTSTCKRETVYKFGCVAYFSVHQIAYFTDWIFYRVKFITYHFVIGDKLEEPTDFLFSFDFFQLSILLLEPMAVFASKKRQGSKLLRMPNSVNLICSTFHESTNELLAGNFPKILPDLLIVVQSEQDQCERHLEIRKNGLPDAETRIFGVELRACGAIISLSTNRHKLLSQMKRRGKTYCAGVTEVVCFAKLLTSHSLSHSHRRFFLLAPHI